LPARPERRLTYGRAAFWMGIGLALEQAGDLIQECSQADCPKLYVKLRGQKYCSTGCGQRDRSARHYQTHRAEVLEQ
jgi:predicted RNA-binding Zn ribbon-like protein